MSEKLVLALDQGTTSSRSIVFDKKGNEGGKTIRPYDTDDTAMAIACDPIVEYMSAEQLKKSIERTRRQMEKAAEKMEFIEAAQYRDEMFKLMEILKLKTEN